jgi:chromosome segregation ATPase
MHFLMNKEQNKGRSSQKLVSGSQFRNITKLGMGKCEQCLLFDRVNKKHKETIRSLRLQIARLEETNHDLRKFKGSDFPHHASLKSSTLASASSAVEDDEDNMEDIQYLANKCETYEADQVKLKKLLVYERSLNEGLRKTLDETRTGLRDELASCQAENAKLREDWQREKTRREFLQTSSDETTTTLLRYKQQLEKAEAKLSDCLL